MVAGVRLYLIWSFDICKENKIYVVRVVGFVFLLSRGGRSRGRRVEVEF